MSGERYEQVGWLHTPTGEVYSMTEWDYIRPETHEPVYVKVPVDPVAPIMQELERCPTCRSDVRWKRGRMVFDTPCWDPWHSAPLVEGEQG